MSGRFRTIWFLVAIAFVLGRVSSSPADGKVMPPRKYTGSLEERAQEAIIIFHGSKKSDGAVEDLILKISVAGNVDNFAWIIPFPNQPEVEQEDVRLFKEVFDYVEARRSYRSRDGKSDAVGATKNAAAPAADVEVLSREVVGSFDVAVVRENQPGKLNQWLDQEGFQTLEDADDVLDFYREKQYVYACIKVDKAQLNLQKAVDIHPLRFTFETGGRDGIYFPMKMTGLQNDPFDVNLYVFYRFWLNDRLNKFGYEHRGFRRRFRDWDSKGCVPNGGKAFSAPQTDPYLKRYARKFPNVTKLLQKLHPGERYYLTNIQARNLAPAVVRQWKDDLWMFPFYTNGGMVPYDVRNNGVASAAWPNEPARKQTPSRRTRTLSRSVVNPQNLVLLVVVLLAGLAIGFAVGRMKTNPSDAGD